MRTAALLVIIFFQPTAIPAGQRPFAKTAPRSSKKFEMPGSFAGGQVRRHSRLAG